MIFVTVGTHEQPFNRLIKKVDELVYKGLIKEHVIMQIGFSTYGPKNCEWHKMMSFEEMQDCFKNARIVITHGGPSSFIEALSFNKVPVVVPRQEKYHEHVNNHQVDFVKVVNKRMNNIIPVYDINQLQDVIRNYSKLSKSKNANENSNNVLFNQRLEQIVDDLVKNKEKKS